MAQSIVGQENVQPYKFSECSKKDYIDALRTGHGLCLLNKPNEVRDAVYPPSLSLYPPPMPAPVRFVQSLGDSPSTENR